MNGQPAMIVSSSKGRFLVSGGHDVVGVVVWLVADAGRLVTHMSRGR